MNERIFVEGKAVPLEGSKFCTKNPHTATDSTSSTVEANCEQRGHLQPPELAKQVIYHYQDVKSGWGVMMDSLQAKTVWEKS
jgi:hypothetical protein